jgi:uncharacterized damage-inducible protein DinB
MTPRQRWFDRRFAFDIPVERFAEVVERLRGTPARLSEQVVTLEAGERTAKPGGAWSIQENVGHLLDLEPLWWARWESFRDHLPALVPADLENRRTHVANHNHADPCSLLEGFRRARARLVGSLEGAEESLRSATALHPRLQQPMRLIDHAYFVAEHDDHHLATISALLRQLRPP